MLLSTIFPVARRRRHRPSSTVRSLRGGRVAPVMYNLAINRLLDRAGAVHQDHGRRDRGGAGMHCPFVVQLPALRSTFRWMPGIRTGDPMTRQTLQMMLPRALALGLSGSRSS
ncbi:MAG: hypothetical protein U0869_07235 [Chloroflexota bacterium]